MQTRPERCVRGPISDGVSFHFVTSQRRTTALYGCANEKLQPRERYMGKIMENEDPLRKIRDPANGLEISSEASIWKSNSKIMRRVRLFLLLLAALRTWPKERKLAFSSGYRRTLSECDRSDETRSQRGQTSLQGKSYFKRLVVFVEERESAISFN